MNQLEQGTRFLNFKNIESKMTFLGVILMKIGTGGVMIWGQLSLYFFSYFRLHDKQVQLSQVSLMLNIGMLPVGLGMFYSNKIAEYVGYERLIRLGGILYPLGIFLTGFSESYLEFGFYYVIFALSSFSLAALPVLNCLWSHFPDKDAGKVSGIVFFFQGISSSIYSYVAFQIINPDNQHAEVVYQETSESQEIYIFGESVASKIPFALKFLGILYGVFTITGAFMITYNKTKPLQQEQQHQQLQELDQIQNRDGGKDPESYREQVDEDNQREQETAPKLTYTQLFMLKPFPTFYLAAFCLCVYVMFLAMNLKSYGMLKVQDDRFLTIVGGVNVILSAMSTVVWGILTDTKPTKTLLMFAMTSFIIVGIAFPILNSSKFFFTLLYLLLGIINSGILTITGPALIRFFGKELTKQLLPIKTSSIYIAIMLSPVLIILSLRVLNFDLVFILIALLSISSVYLISKMEDPPLKILHTN